MNAAVALVTRPLVARGHAGIRGRILDDSGKPTFALKRPDNGLPEDIREHMRLSTEDRSALTDARIACLAPEPSGTREPRLALWSRKCLR